MKSRWRRQAACGGRSLSVCGVALVLALSLISGCARPINRAAERRIRDLLPDLLGSARQYRVHVDSPPADTISGRLAHVAVDGDDVQLSNGLLLDRLHLDLEGVDVDTGRKRLRSIRHAGFAATVGQAALDEFLAGEEPAGENLRNTRVVIGAGDQVAISGERVTLGLGVPFRMSGPLRIASPQRLELDPTRLTVIGIPITGIALRFLKSRFESAVDLSTLPFAVTLSGIQTVPGHLTLTGEADVTSLAMKR